MQCAPKGVWCAVVYPGHCSHHASRDNNVFPIARGVRLTNCQPLFATRWAGTETASSNNVSGGTSTIFILYFVFLVGLLCGMLLEDQLQIHPLQILSEAMQVGHVEVIESTGAE